MTTAISSAPQSGLNLDQMSREELRSVIEALSQQLTNSQTENARLSVENQGLAAQNRLAQQTAESLGDLNRYYANQALIPVLGRLPTETEYFIYYIEHGGKSHFDQIHPPR